MPLPRNPNAFAHSPLDRAGHLRTDASELARLFALEQSRCVVFHDRRPLLTEHDGALRAASAPPLWRADAAPIFLGHDASGQCHFGIETQNPDAFAELGRFEDMRAAGMRMGADAADDIAILGCAKSMFEWHARHGFCSNCGSKSEIAEAGWKRVCPACNAEHFPRVDPVVIMLPVFGDKCLLARQAAWPKGMMSAIAGYMEPGETIEEAVARETLEEVGLPVSRVTLHSSQPWPFPSSLMLGAHCEVGHDDVRVDQKELETARWFTREEAALLLKRKLPDFFCPPPFAIAHQLLKSWVGD